MSNETWIEMFDFPTYEVSNLGRIRNEKTKRILTKKIDGKDYMLISLYYNKKKYTKRSARLVWQSFNNCFCKHTIDHINRDRSDDRIENLRCITMEENYKNRTLNKVKNKYNLTDELKREIQLKINSGQYSSWDIMKQYKIPINYIQTTIKRNSWQKYLLDEKL